MSEEKFKELYKNTKKEEIIKELGYKCIANNELVYEIEILKEQQQELVKEIERLTDLCNKYEEEHKTTFETWQKDIKENEQLHSIIKEAREYLTDEGVCILNKGMKENERLVWTWENYYDLLEILDKESNNEKD